MQPSFRQVTTPDPMPVHGGMRIECQAGVVDIERSVPLASAQAIKDAVVSAALSSRADDTVALGDVLSEVCRRNQVGLYANPYKQRYRVVPVNNKIMFG